MQSPYLVPEEEDPNQSYIELVNTAISGPCSFRAKRERIDEFGWRHFGDLYADHEGVFSKCVEPMISHYNNQYDAIRGFAIQYMRSGNIKWLALMNELARHVTDIDVYHTDMDKSAYNQGLFWHTEHYVEAGRSTHRSFPRVEGVYGGGPAPGHLYTTGLMMHYFLTGCRYSREAVITLGQYVIDCDDGNLTIFRFMDRGDTGHASEAGLDRYHGPGRTAANAIVALIDAHRLSGEKKFVDKAEQLIRRSIHPHDDLEVRDLLDTENRWYYTIFLKSLDHYLNRKIELGELDHRYAYAQSALLAYVRWACEHEYPYLENPELLEYPNETWAAQDMHKSEMFKLGAKHGGENERARFLQRSNDFFEYSVSSLSRMKTRTLTRPIVLMLSFGYAHAYFTHERVYARDGYHCAASGCSS